jgi:ssDNA-binding Zn-finger/Zn-ribbon topoisomerase 1
MANDTDKEFRVCPNCNYTRGFHVFFNRTRGKTKIGLICPQCGTSYDLGWLTTNIKSLKGEKGEVF